MVSVFPPFRNGFFKGVGFRHAFHLELSLMESKMNKNIYIYVVKSELNWKRA